MGNEGQGSDEGTQEVIDDSAVAETEVSGSNEESQEVKLNPAWNELLEVVPSQLHSQVLPHLKNWDRNYQQGIDKVHSQYEPYKNYLENKVSPEQIDYAMNVVRAVEERPEEMVKALQAYMGISKSEAEEVVAASEGTGEVDTEIPEELFTHPKFQQMEQTLQSVAQYLVQQQQTLANEQEDQKLTKELADLKTAHGEFDEEYVLTKALADPNKPLETHVKEYQSRISEALAAKQRTPGPKVLGNGGSAPDNQITKESLNDPKVRKSMIAQMLSQTQQS